MKKTGFVFPVNDARKQKILMKINKTGETGETKK